VLFFGFPNWRGGCRGRHPFFGTYDVTEKIMVALAVHNSKVYKTDEAINHWLIQYGNMEGKPNGKK